jgi:hypothetical protein
LIAVGPIQAGSPEAIDIADKYPDGTPLCDIYAHNLRNIEVGRLMLEDLEH